MDDLLVIKVGGSILKIGQLPQTLRVISTRNRPTIVVPGGGPFADSIRTIQDTLKFSDSTAHRMALLAMHQFACLIIENSKTFVGVDTLEELKSSISLDLIPVWLPERIASTADDIPQKWSMTSDGLAAWLAHKLGGAEVCLLKSCTIPQNSTLYELYENGIIDPEFYSLVERCGLKWSVIEMSNEKELIKRICKSI